MSKENKLLPLSSRHCLRIAASAVLTLFENVLFIRNGILSVFRKIWDINTSPNRHSLMLPYTCPLFHGTRRCVCALHTSNKGDRHWSQLFQGILTLSVKLYNIPSTCINTKGIIDFQSDDAPQTRKETCDDNLWQKGSFNRKRKLTTKYYIFKTKNKTKNIFVRLFPFWSPWVTVLR